VNAHTRSDKHPGRARRSALIALLACLLLLGPWPAWGAGAATTFSIRLQLLSVAAVNVVRGTGGEPMLMIGHTGTYVPPQVYVSGSAAGDSGTALQPVTQSGSTGWSVPLPRAARDTSGMVMTLLYL